MLDVAVNMHVSVFTLAQAILSIASCSLTDIKPAPIDTQGLWLHAFADAPVPDE
ncbi:hypothetical protein [Bifidobacterium sp. ESL0800]|uniref:hypothetical protein n=1 Tax=Bifidobacterium sp. ESL0800 TaxID=2983236 RepID=UPI0023F72D89|nr:hypothetical protein [Bifidobacterium sp. ESL0800]WEV76297.1 hypothetical protein OZX75_03700 [Bifidobacterium sp. ESL0800]